MSAIDRCQLYRDLVKNPRILISMALFWYYLNNLARINPNEWCVIIPVMLRCWWIAWMFIKKGQKKISCLNIMLWPWLSSFWNRLICYSTSNRYWMKCCGIKESISIWKVFIFIVITSIWNNQILIFISLEELKNCRFLHHQKVVDWVSGKIREEDDKLTKRVENCSMDAF